MAIWKGSHNPILSGLKYSRRCLLTTETNWDDPPSTEQRQLGERRGVVADLLVHRMGWIFWRCFFLCAWNHVSWFSLFIWGEHVSFFTNFKKIACHVLGMIFVTDTYMLGKYSAPLQLLCVFLLAYRDSPCRSRWLQTNILGELSALKVSGRFRWVGAITMLSGVKKWAQTVA